MTRHKETWVCKQYII